MAIHAIDSGKVFTVVFTGDEAFTSKRPALATTPQWKWVRETSDMPADATRIRIHFLSKGEQIECEHEAMREVEEIPPSTPANPEPAARKVRRVDTDALLEEAVERGFVEWVGHPGASSASLPKVPRLALGALIWSGSTMPHDPFSEPSSG